MTVAADLFALIDDLVMRHSPSGVEGEVDAFLVDAFAARGLRARRDAAGNLIARIPGRGGGRLAITAHKDEIGAIVTAVEADGRVRVRKLGGSYPWIYGEGPVDLLGDSETVTGVLSFGSRHVSHASPQHAHMDTAPVKWADAWVETKRSAEALAAAGVRPGTRLVVGKHRKRPLRLGDHIASYTLDNKASVAVLLDLAGRVKDPLPEIWLVASAKEEVGALGALHFAANTSLDAMVALEVAPLAPEYGMVDGPSPVLFAEDSFGLYDEELNALVRRAAASVDVPLQHAVVSGFGSDGSVSVKYGHVPRAACLGFATQNTHGYEIARLDAVANCAKVLEALCGQDFTVLAGEIEPTS